MAMSRTRQGSGKVWASSERSSAKREEVRTICRARMSGCCGDGMRGRTDQQIDEQRRQAKKHRSLVGTRACDAPMWRLTCECLETKNIVSMRLVGASLQAAVIRTNLFLMGGPVIM